MGKDRLALMEDEPERFRITRSPHAHRMAYADLMKAAGPLRGKRVLELGSGRGEFAVYLAKQGGEVTGIDIGPHLTAASRELAAINRLSCEFMTGNITQLPFADEEFDLVIGIAILHHLVESDLRKGVTECHRVLRANGRALVIEPVENSKAFMFMQNLFPVGTKGTPDYRPSLFQRAAWRGFLARRDHRTLTNVELVSAGQPFRSTSVRPYGFLVRLSRLLGRRTKQPLLVLDNALFRVCPPLRRLCQQVLIEYRK